MVAWVIFDEAHYFYSDACFNSHLDQLLWKLPDLFSRTHRLYLTATPGAVLPDICAAEQSNLKTCGQCRFCHRDRAGKLLMYQFPNHSGSVKLAYFRQIDEIADLMASRPGEEFLIFTFRRETGDISDTRSYKKALASRSITFEYRRTSSSYSFRAPFRRRIPSQAASTPPEKKAGSCCDIPRIFYGPYHKRYRKNETDHDNFDTLHMSSFLPLWAGISFYDTGGWFCTASTNRRVSPI